MENYGGWSFKILDVNLSNENIKEKKLDVETARKFLGGRGLGVKILCDASRKHGIFGALSDKNPLVFAVGPLTGLAPMSGRHVVISKSPLTGTVFDSSAGGFFGVELKFAGYDGEVDITQAERIVAVGRGVGDYSDEKVRSIIEELANELGAVIACSRPIVDKGWLPKDRQVGTSGKTVKPKLYLALGISGAFQHVAGMSASETIVAVNKDPKAPIFTVADYGIVDDLFKVVPVLTEKVREAKGGS